MICAMVYLLFYYSKHLMCGIRLGLASHHFYQDQLSHKKIGYFFWGEGRMWVFVSFHTLTLVPSKGRYQVHSGLGTFGVVNKLSVFMTNTYGAMKSFIS